MPVPVFKSGWSLDFEAFLQKKIAAIVRQETPKVTVNKEEILSIAEKFLRFYRANLTLSPILVNLQVPSLSASMEGYPTRADAISTPMWGAIGIPRGRISSIGRIINKISLDNYVNLTIFDSPESSFGLLSMDFLGLSYDTDAGYYDGTTVVYWTRLVEYGFEVPSHIYLRKRGLGRSGYGIMGKSRSKMFRMAATHVFEDVFNETIKLMTTEELRKLQLKFID